MIGPSSSPAPPVAGTPALTGQVSLLTGGFDRPYAFGMAMCLAAEHVSLDVIGSDEVNSPEMHTTAGLRFINIQPRGRAKWGAAGKATRLLRTYWRLVCYAFASEASIFHILWNPRVWLFDRTLLMLLYKALGKRIAFTAHNVNTAKRDGTDTWLNRQTLRIQYLLADHIFVHSHKMKDELVTDFRVTPARVTVIPFGINNAVAHTSITQAEARRTLGLGQDNKVLLFFGRIQPYKGLDVLLDALALLKTQSTDQFCLVIAGEPKKEHQRYWDGLGDRIRQGDLRDSVLERIEYIPDEQTELYFKAADVLILPYRDIYQSGVLFLGYSFGLPVIATKVGAFEEEVIAGQTGLICRPNDPADLARTITSYFASALYADRDRLRSEIAAFARIRYSWEEVGKRTTTVYRDLLEPRTRPSLDKKS